MPKRFFNTLLIEEGWYIDLSLKHRELLRYCESKCDQAGIFSFNSKIASTYIGEKVSESDLGFIPVQKLPNGKFIIVGFCFFQNGNLSPNSPAHKPVFRSLEENNIPLNTLSDSLSDTLSNRVQEKETVKEEGKEIEEEKGKGKEGRAKKINQVFNPPSEKEVIDYFFDNGYLPEAGSKAWKYYHEAGWVDSKGNKVRNWKQKMQGVWFKDENKINNGKQQLNEADRGLLKIISTPVDLRPLHEKISGRKFDTEGNP